MQFQLIQNPNQVQMNIKPNGLGCPQCCSPLVDGFAGVNAHGLTKETHCLNCDYTSTYNVNTLVLAKQY